MTVQFNTTHLNWNSNILTGQVSVMGGINLSLEDIHDYDSKITKFWSSALRKIINNNFLEYTTERLDQ